MGARNKIWYLLSANLNFIFFLFVTVVLAFNAVMSMILLSFLFLFLLFSLWAPSVILLFLWMKQNDSGSISFRLISQSLYHTGPSKVRWHKWSQNMAISCSGIGLLPWLHLCGIKSPVEPVMLLCPHTRMYLTNSDNFFYKTPVLYFTSCN